MREFAPVSAWVLDYAKQSCVLKRDFQNGADSVRLELHQYGPGPALTLVVASSTLSKADSRLTAQVDTANSSDSVFLATYDGVVRPQNADNEARQRNGTPPPAVKAQGPLVADNMVGTIFKSYLAPPRSGGGMFPEGTKTSVNATNVFNENIALMTDSLSEPLAALHKCSDELAASWDADIVSPVDLGSEPIIQEFERYPRKWIDNRWLGGIDVWAVIDEAGKRLGCVVDPMSTAPRAMQVEFCEHLPPSGHTPATNKDGQPVKAVGFSSFIYYVKPA